MRYRREISLKSLTSSQVRTSRRCGCLGTSAEKMAKSMRFSFLIFSPSLSLPLSLSLSLPLSLSLVIFLSIFPSSLSSFLSSSPLSSSLGWFPLDHCTTLYCAPFEVDRSGGESTSVITDLKASGVAFLNLATAPIILGGKGIAKIGEVGVGVGEGAIRMLLPKPKVTPMFGTQLELILRMPSLSLFHFLSLSL